MSPALASISSPIARTVPSLPHIDNWSNRVPEDFSKLENRVSYLTTESNRHLEMHPNGTRGVKNYTEYCMLTIFVVNIIRMKLDASWAQNKGQSPWDIPSSANNGQFLDSRHVIMGNKTGLYLCMDDNSVPYQTLYKNDSRFKEHCYFHHEQLDHRESYYRLINGTKRWYLGINPDGTVRCGNVTRRSQKGARFNKSSERELDLNAPEPYKPSNKPCCLKDKCRHNRKRRGEKCKKKKWCRRKRRQFFKLSLKELKRYFNRCIKQKRKIRHCKDR